MPSTARWLTRTEAAERLRVKPGTVDAWAREGKLPRYFPGKTRRFARYRIEDVDAYLAETAEGKDKK